MNLISSWCQLRRGWPFTWIHVPKKIAGNLGCAYQAKNDVPQLDVRRIIVSSEGIAMFFFGAIFPQGFLSTHVKNGMCFFVSDRFILSTNYVIILVNILERTCVFFQAWSHK